LTNCLSIPLRVTFAHIQANTSTAQPPIAIKYTKCPMIARSLPVLRASPQSALSVEPSVMKASRVTSTKALSMATTLSRSGSRRTMREIAQNVGVRSRNRKAAITWSAKPVGLISAGYV
ncbi:hypothetical protein MMC27_008600, partial [Xylographa pallens]|nr:hypothetical protein [Xylographa pallens]